MHTLPLFHPHCSPFGFSVQLLIFEHGDLFPWVAWSSRQHPTIQLQSLKLKSPSSAHVDKKKNTLSFKKVGIKKNEHTLWVSRQLEPRAEQRQWGDNQPPFQSRWLNPSNTAWAQMPLYFQRRLGAGSAKRHPRGWLWIRQAGSWLLSLTVYRFR